MEQKEPPATHNYRNEDDPGVLNRTLHGYTLHGIQSLPSEHILLTDSY